MPSRVDDSQLSSSLIGRQSCYEPSGNCYQELSLDNLVTNPRVTVTKVYSLFRQFCHESPGTVTRTTSFLDYLVKPHRTCFKISSNFRQIVTNLQVTLTKIPSLSRQYCYEPSGICYQDCQTLYTFLLRTFRQLLPRCLVSLDNPVMKLSVHWNHCQVSQDNAATNRQATVTKVSSPVDYPITSFRLLLPRCRVSQDNPFTNLQIIFRTLSRLDNSSVDCYQGIEIFRQSSDEPSGNCY